MSASTVSLTSSAWSRWRYHDAGFLTWGDGPEAVRLNLDGLATGDDRIETLGYLARFSWFDQAAQQGLEAACATLLGAGVLSR